MSNPLKCIHCGAQLSRAAPQVCAVCGKSQSAPPVVPRIAAAPSNPPTEPANRSSGTTRRLTENLLSGAALPDDSRQDVTLLVNDGGTIHTYTLGNTTLNFGRAPTNDIVCPARVVSGRHAQIISTGEAHTITDVGSTNGLLVDGERLPVNTPHTLTHGELIVIGDPATANIVTLTYHNPVLDARIAAEEAAAAALESERTVAVGRQEFLAPTGRNPYTVGSPTRGVHFYGRREIARALLENNDQSIWVVGNRRMGKTSLMRFVEQQSESQPNIVAFYINLEASENFEDLSECFYDDLELADTRLKKLGLTPEQLQNRDAAEIVRLLNRGARANRKQVLLLWDEAEALIRLGEASNAALRRLHREVQRTDSLRLIITATKRLEALNELCRDWETSAFLYSFKMHYLGPLSLDEAAALVCQRQQSSPLTASPALIRQIFDATGGHPYLVQWLCDRLYSDSTLRVPNDDDTIPNSGLVSLFQTDYNHLSPGERRILRVFVSVEEVSEDALVRQLDGTFSPPEVRYILQGLQALCYIRRTSGGYRAGSRFLQNWLSMAQLDETQVPVTDAATIEMADDQRQHIQKMITIRRRNLFALEEQQAQYGAAVPLELINNIRQTTEAIAELEQQLKTLRGE